jgi:hypothetical protein
VRESLAQRALRGWVWHFVRRHANKLEQMKIYPQEDSRIRDTNEIARIHVANLVDYIQDAPIELIFNIDEVGSQE